MELLEIHVIIINQEEPIAIPECEEDKRNYCKVLLDKIYESEIQLKQ
jgi:hypothetical protein